MQGDRTTSPSLVPQNVELTFQPVRTPPLDQLILRVQRSMADLAERGHILLGAASAKPAQPSIQKAVMTRDDPGCKRNNLLGARRIDSNRH